MSKATRIKACELAAQCIGSEVAAGGSTAGRLMDARTHTVIGRDYGVHRSMVYRIKLRKKWAHLAA